MPSYLHPGVYLEEIASGSRPIEGVATSVTAFVGHTYRGEVGVPKLIGKLDDYVNEFGPIVEDDPMGLAVQAFYLNGGGSGYICRLAGDTETAVNDAEIKSQTNSVPVLLINASSSGKWGNNLRFQIEKSYKNARFFNLVIGALIFGEFEENERFDNLTMNESLDDFILTRVNGNSNLITVEVIAPASQYQNAEIIGSEINFTNDVKVFLESAVTDKTFKISINGSPMKIVSLDNIDTNDENSVGSAIQNAIRDKLGTTNLDVQYANTDTNISISTIDPPTSLDSILLGDSELLDVLGLSSKNVAEFIGKNTNPLQINTNNSFTIKLDSLDPVEIKFIRAYTSSDGAEVASEIQKQVRIAFENIPSYSNFTCSYDISNSSFTLKSGNSDVVISDISLANTNGTPLAELEFDDKANDFKIGRTINQGIDNVTPLQILGVAPFKLGALLSGGIATKPISGDFTTFYNKTLRKFRDISILVVPGSSWDGGLGQANLSASLAHCEFMKNRVLILDPPEGIDLDNAVKVDALGLPTSTYSVLYYPWVSMNNPLYHPDKNPLVDKTVNVAPSSIAAGMWAKIDGKRGVWKAPAGVNTQITGALGLEFIVENLEQDQLNPLGVNSIRKIPNFGSVFWGARTLATKANPEWRYVPVRRTAIFIEESIYNGVQWAVFEPNTHLLWSSLRANIGSFMNGLFRSGAFQGEKANDAYFVRCGLGDTMTQGDIDSGQVIVLVGFAPVKPAEFVIVRIQQKVGEE